MLLFSCVWFVCSMPILVLLNITFILLIFVSYLFKYRRDSLQRPVSAATTARFQAYRQRERRVGTGNLGETFRAHQPYSGNTLKNRDEFHVT